MKFLTKFTNPDGVDLWINHRHIIEVASSTEKDQTILATDELTFSVKGSLKNIIKKLDKIHNEATRRSHTG